MTQRQKAHAFVGFALRHHGQVTARRVHHVSMRQHCALRLAGRARRVDQDREIVGSAYPQPCLPQLWMRRVILGADALQLVETDHSRIAELMQALHIEHDDLSQQRQSRTHLERLIELLFVLDEQIDRSRIGHQILDLARGVGRVDAGAHAPCPQNSEIRIQPFASRVRQHRDGFSRLEAESHQAKADCTRAVTELAPAGAAPDAQFLLP